MAQEIRPRCGPCEARRDIKVVPLRSLGRLFEDLDSLPPKVSRHTGTLFTQYSEHVCIMESDMGLGPNGTIHVF